MHMHTSVGVGFPRPFCIYSVLQLSKVQFLSVIICVYLLCVLHLQEFTLCSTEPTKILILHL